MKGGLSIVGILGNAISEEKFPMIVEEWFDNRGATFTADEYKNDPRNPALKTATKPH